MIAGGAAFALLTVLSNVVAYACRPLFPKGSASLVACLVDLPADLHPVA
jgi:hypothetical protein